MLSYLRRTFPVRNRILALLPALAMMIAMTACGPKPTEPSGTPPPAGGPTEPQAPTPDGAPGQPQAPAPDGTPGEPQAAAPGQPGAPGQPATPGEDGEPGENLIETAPDDTTDTAVLFVRKIQAHWQDVNGATLPPSALETYDKRSKDGFLQFQSEKGIHQVKIGEATVTGPEPDFSMRMSAKAMVDGQERNAVLVVMKDDKNNLTFDSIILEEPEGLVSYGWSEQKSVWVAGQGAKTRP